MSKKPRRNMSPEKKAESISQYVAFLSYNREDGALARELKRCLTKIVGPVFLDRTNISSKQEPQEAIEAAAGRSQKIVALVRDKNSDWVDWEIERFEVPNRILLLMEKTDTRRNPVLRGQNGIHCYDSDSHDNYSVFWQLYCAIRGCEPDPNNDDKWSEEGKNVLKGLPVPPFNHPVPSLKSVSVSRSRFARWAPLVMIAGVLSAGAIWMKTQEIGPEDKFELPDGGIVMIPPHLEPTPREPGAGISDTIIVDGGPRAVIVKKDKCPPLVTHEAFCTLELRISNVCGPGRKFATPNYEQALAYCADGRGRLITAFERRQCDGGKNDKAMSEWVVGTSTNRPHIYSEGSLEEVSADWDPDRGFRCRSEDSGP